MPKGVQPAVGWGPTTEVGLAPRDVHASPRTGRSVVGHGVAQTVPAVGAGADVVAAVVQVGQGADCGVAGLERGGHQERAGLLCEPGCGEERGSAQGEGSPVPPTGTVSQSPRPQEQSTAPTLNPPHPLLCQQQVLQKQRLALGICRNFSSAANLLS